MSRPRGSDAPEPDQVASGVQVRSASAEDAQACAAIYTPYVLETAITFEDRPPSAADVSPNIGSRCGADSIIAPGNAFLTPPHERISILRIPGH